MDPTWAEMDYKKTWPINDRHFGPCSHTGPTCQQNGGVHLFMSRSLAVRLIHGSINSLDVPRLIAPNLTRCPIAKPSSALSPSPSLPPASAAGRRWRRRWTRPTLTITSPRTRSRRNLPGVSPCNSPNPLPLRLACFSISLV